MAAHDTHAPARAGANATSIPRAARGDVRHLHARAAFAAWCGAIVDGAAAEVQAELAAESVHALMVGVRSARLEMRR